MSKELPVGVAQQMVKAMTYAQKKEAADNKLNVIASLDTAVRLLTNGADRSNPTHLAALKVVGA